MFHNCQYTYRIFLQTLAMLYLVLSICFLFTVQNRYARTLKCRYELFPKSTKIKLAYNFLTLSLS